MSAADCSKAAQQKHDHAAEGSRDTPHMQAQPCPPDTSAPAASAAAATSLLGRRDAGESLTWISRPPALANYPEKAASLAALFS
jgi:hypothetical protein